ncbi:MAG: TolC family protein [Candidatus Kapaibacterium sp.]
MRIILFVIIGMMASATVTAQQNNTYSLRECLRIAVDNNLRILSSESEIGRSKVEQRSAFGDYLPTMRASAGYQRILEGSIISNGISLPYDPPPNNYNLNLQAQLLIFDGFTREARYEMSDKTLDFWQLTNRFNHMMINYRVYVEYTNIIKNAQLVKIRRENLEQTRSDLERIRAQFDAGVVPVSAVYSQEAELGNREFDLIQAQNDFSVSKTALMKTMGIRPDINAEFLESSIPSTVDSAEIAQFREIIGTTRNAIEIAFEKRPDYIAAKRSLEIAEASVTAARGSYFPSLSAFVNGGWNWEDGQTGFLRRNNSSFGLSLNVPIFQNFNVAEQVANAENSKSQSSLDLYETEQNIIAEIQTAILNLDAAEKQLEVAQRSIWAAERNFESSRERFELGAASITEFIQAQTQQLTARINRVTAVYNYLQAKKEIQFRIGLIK